MKKGFTLVEIMVVIAILGILTAIVAVTLSGSKDVKKTISEANKIVSVLGEAKSAAISGKSDSKHGVAFTEDSYTRFVGDSYDANSASNIVYGVIDGISLSNNIAGADDAIIFNKLTGEITQAATVTVSLIDDPSRTVFINIDAFGNTSIVE